MAPDFCPAAVHVADDRNGGWFHYCERPAGHKGSHRRTLLACEPVARMCWDDAGGQTTTDDGGAT